MNWILTLIILLISLVSVPLRADTDLEVKLQGAFIYRFIPYVKWDSPKWKNATNYKINVLGDRSLFNELLNSKQHEGKYANIDVIFNNTVSNLEGQIVVLKYSNPEHNRATIALLKDCHCLIISSQDGMALEGAVINFVRLGKRLGFEINPDAAKRNRLTISSKLLTLARIVGK